MNSSIEAIASAIVDKVYEDTQDMAEDRAAAKMEADEQRGVVDLKALDNAEADCAIEVLEAALALAKEQAGRS